MRRAITLDDETWERLKAYEGRTGGAWTVLLRHLVERWVAEGEPDLGPPTRQKYRARAEA